MTEGSDLYMVERRKPGRRPADPAARFLAKVDRRGPDDCWPWTAGTTCGYGSFRLRAGKAVSAHGYAKFLDTGVECPAGLHPVHTCKTPGSALCCNPAHIIYAAPGSTAIRLSGLDNPRTRLSDHDITELVRRARAGERNVDLARAYGVCAQYVSNLKNGQGRAAGVPR